jgi:hypothetical protein
LKVRSWLTFVLGLLAGAVLAGTIASAAFGCLSLQLCPLPGTSAGQPPAGSALLSALGAQWLLAPRFLLPVLTIAVTLGLWSLLGSFRRSREPLPLVLGLVGGAAAVITGVIRALTHQHAYFLGYPGLGLFVVALITVLVLQRPRPGDASPAR